MAGEMITRIEDDPATDPGPGKLATQALRGRLPIADIVEAARAMSKSDLLPFVLRRSNTPETVMGNCYLIISQALAWGMDPMAVASQIYVVDGRMAYQGRFIAALINTRADLKARLSVEFTGEGDELTCTVSGQFKKEAKPRVKTCKLKDVRGKSGLWKTDPQNKLWYTTVLAWAALHWPEGTLAIQDDVDQESILNITPPKEVSNGVHQANVVQEETREEKVAESRPAQEGDNQTLQSALSEQEATVKAMDAPAAGDRIDFQLLQRVKAQLEILFGLKGIDHTPEGLARQAEIVGLICAKRKVQRLEDLTNAQGLDLEGKIDLQIFALHAVKEAAAQKH